MSPVKLTCIGCPLGCLLDIVMKDGEVGSIAGSTCPRGDAYARKEMTDPTRIVTSTVRVTGSGTGAATVSCKTRTDISKAKIFDCIRAMKGVAVPAPVHIGDVILSNVAGTGVDVIATKEVF